MKFSAEEAPDESRTLWPEAAYIAQRRAIADRPVYLRIANPYRARPAIRVTLSAGRRERARELRLKASFARPFGGCRSEAESLNRRRRSADGTVAASIRLSSLRGSSASGYGALSLR